MGATNHGTSVRDRESPGHDIPVTNQYWPLMGLDIPVTNQYWPLIGHDVPVTNQYWPLIGREGSRDLDPGL